MSENAIQVTLELDIKALQSGLKEGKSAVEEQTKEMAKDFEELSKRSKEALDDLEKASKLAGLNISDEVKDALNEIPKLAKGIAEVFSGGSILSFIGVLLDVGIALKALYDDVILLKGAKEEWEEVNKKLADSEEELDTKIRKNTIEHIRLTQGEAAAAHAALAVADQDLVSLGKDFEEILSNKKSNKLSDGLKKDLQDLTHFNFGELPNKINDITAAVGRADAQIADLEKQLKEANENITDEGSAEFAASIDRKLQIAKGEVDILNHALDLLKKAETEHQQTKGNETTHADQLDQAEAERKRRQREEQLRQSIALQNAEIEGAKRVSDARFQQEEEADRAILQQHTLSAEQELALQTSLEDRKFKADEDYLQAKLKQFERDRTHNPEQIIALQSQIEALQIEHNTRLLRIDEEYQQRLDKDAKQALRDEIKGVEDRAAATKAGSRERVRILEDELRKLEADGKTDTEEYQRLLRQKMQADKEYQKEQEEIEKERLKRGQQHNQALDEMERLRLDFERQIGKISESEYESRLKAQIDSTFVAERNQLRIEQSRYQQGTREYEKYETDIQKLTDKHDREIEKLEQKSLQRRRQQFDQYFQQVSSSFNNALNGWIQGTESASQAFGKMFQDILSQFISFVEQWLEKKFEMWLMDQLISKKKGAQNVGEAASNTAVAATEALASVPWPFNIAAASETEAAGLGYVAEAGVAFFEKGGIVPATGLALVHQGERVLPASMSGNGDLGFGSVHVHLSVNAIDSDSFQHTIKRHGNMIGNEVARVLKKRGITSR